jgi:hypothetical protein
MHVCTGIVSLICLINEIPELYYRYTTNVKILHGRRVQCIISIVRRVAISCRLSWKK